MYLVGRALQFPFGSMTDLICSTLASSQAVRSLLRPSPNDDRFFLPLLMFNIVLILVK